MDKLRAEDRGYLLEHLVLVELQSRFLRTAIFYWRDKQKHFDPAGLAAFRRRHPTGTNILVCLDAPRPTVRVIGGVEVEVVPYSALGKLLDDL